VNLSAEQDVMQLMLSTPVPTARARPLWVDDSAHWTEIGEIQSHYVPVAARPRRPWLPMLLALSAALTTTAASAVTVLTVLIVAFVL